MSTPNSADTGLGGTRTQLLPLYAAGFVTAFGAHSIAATLGGYTDGPPTSLLTLGLLLAIYDGAEVILKPVFGSLADRNYVADIIELSISKNRVFCLFWTVLVSTF